LANQVKSANCRARSKKTIRPGQDNLAVPDGLPLSEQIFRDLGCNRQPDEQTEMNIPGIPAFYHDSATGLGGPADALAASTRPISQVQQRDCGKGC
jgi:hypothetical protein